MITYLQTSVFTAYGNAPAVDCFTAHSIFGNISFYCLYRFFRSVGNFNQASVTIRLNTPTGANGLPTNQGNNVKAHQQFGSGLWNPFVDVFFTRALGTNLFDANVTHTATP